MKTYTLQINKTPVLKTNSIVNAVYRINSLNQEQRQQCQLLDNYTGEVLYHYQYVSSELYYRYNNSIKG